MSSKWWSMVLAFALVLGSESALAKRMGGGFSFGKQSGNVAQRSAAPTAVPQAVPKTAPTQNAATRPVNPSAPAVAPKRPWGAMLGGLAAGLGLAWLASTLGFGEGFAQLLTVALVAIAVLSVIGIIRRRMAPPAAGSGLAYQQAGAAASGNSQLDPSTPRGYSEKNVGNDASARPWERHGADAGTAAGSQGGSMIGSALAGNQVWGVPAGFDTEGFLKASKTNFITLQDAWDRSDIPALRAMMTDGMLEQIKSQLAERELAAGAVSNLTEVVTLEAQLLGIEELDAEYMASVEFSGLIREDASMGPNPFREVWNITRPKSGSGGWLVAGVQALQ
jgi:predicted lipid-binding transport protein (Tim44 family)